MAAGAVNRVLLGGYRLEVWVEKRQERAKAKERREQKFFSLLDLGKHLFFFLSTLAKIQFMYHKIHPLKLYKSVVFRMFTELCNQHHNNF